MTMSREANQLSKAVIEEMIMLTEYIKAAHETIFDGGSHDVPVLSASLCRAM
jgi:hypothetical protein